MKRLFSASSSSFFQSSYLQAAARPQVSGASSVSLPSSSAAAPSRSSSLRRPSQRRPSSPPSRDDAPLPPSHDGALLLPSHDDAPPQPSLRPLQQRPTPPRASTRTAPSLPVARSTEVSLVASLVFVVSFGAVDVGAEGVLLLDSFVDGCCKLYLPLGIPWMSSRLADRSPCSSSRASSTTRCIHSRRRPSCWPSSPTATRPNASWAGVAGASPASARWQPPSRGESGRTRIWSANLLLLLGPSYHSEVTVVEDAHRDGRRLPRWLLGRRRRTLHRDFPRVLRDFLLFYHWQDIHCGLRG